LAKRRPDGQKDLAAYETAIRDWTYPKECEGMDPAGNLRPCQLGPATDRGVLFIGDSFAEQIFSRFAENAKLNPENSFTFLTTPGCPPITGIRKVHDRFHCNGFFEKALQFAKARDFDRIVLVSNWYAYFNPADELICFPAGDGCRIEPERSSYFTHLDAALASLRSRLFQFRKRGAEVVTVGATPSADWDVPLELAKRKFWGIDTKSMEYIDRDEFEKKAAPLTSRLIALASSIGAKFVDPLDFLCENQRCPTIDKDGVPYFIMVAVLLRAESPNASTR
jgi:hypothetical protein